MSWSLSGWYLQSFWDKPWQRQYNCCVNWKKEGIQYDDNDHELFEPFLGEDSYAYPDFDKSEANTSSQSTLKPQLDKGKGKLEENMDKSLHISMSNLDKPSTSLKKSSKSIYKPAT